MKKVNTFLAACVLYSWTANWFPWVIKSTQDDLVSTLSYKEQQMRPLDKLKLKRQLRNQWYTVFSNWTVRNTIRIKYDLNKVQLYDDKVYIPAIKSFWKKRWESGLLIDNPRYQWNLWNIHRSQDKIWKRKRK